ncbi:MAG: sigma-70 family RNA polymerase sigma factor [Rhodospirillales bacterium]
MRDILLHVEPLIPALRRYARTLIQDSAAADELVQDCLERAISGWHRRRKDREVRSWVFAILHNLAVNSLRQRQREARQDAGAAEVALPPPRPEQQDRPQYRALLHALAELPEEQRSVILLVAVEDFSYAETAEVLAVPIGTVMSRLTRGRERLRLILDGGEGARGARTVRRPHLRRVK